VIPLLPSRILGYVLGMKNEPHSRIDELEDEIEQAVDDKRAGVLAADATGMVGNEESTRIVELREGEVTPPV
jgi:hypothetical protein